MLLAGVGSSFAFVDNGLTYRVIDNVAKTVKVTYQGSDAWSNPYTQSTINIRPTATNPLNMETYTVVEIDENAFCNAAMSSIFIDPSVKTIGNNAFQNCINLQNVDLSHVENFGSYIFSGCTSLTSTSVTLPTGITAIPAGMFSGCTSITSFPFPDNIRIEDSAFERTGLSSISASCSSIGSNAFANCPNLTSVNITFSYISISSNAFANCANLTSVKLMGEGVSSGEGGQCSGCNNISSIICFPHYYYSDFGFTNGVKENATVIVPESQVSSWSRNGFVNVQAADVNNVGGHVVDVLGDNYDVVGLSGKGTITVNGENADQMYGQAFVIAPNINVEIGFVPNSDKAWRLQTATINGTDVTTALVNGKYPIPSISGNQLVKATWKQVNTYSLNIGYFDTMYGSVSVNGTNVYGGNTYTYAEGTNITLVIQPNTGYGISIFTVGMVDKKGDLTVNGDGTYSYTFTLKADTNVEIFFEKKWSLTTTFNAGGTVTLDGVSVTSGTTKEIFGERAKVEIKANSGYEITSVLYNGIEQLKGPSTYWNVDPYYGPGQGTNQTLAVTFTVVNPTISGNYDTTMGSVSIAGSQLMPGMPQSYAIGSNVTFTVTPFLGYQIQQVMLYAADGTATDITTTVIANGNSYPIPSINESYSIDVMFGTIPTPPNVTATIGTLGMATLYSPYALDFSGVAGLKAYIVSAFTPANNHAILTQMANVPAKTGVVLVGSAGNYPIPTTTTKTYVANLLKGVDSDVIMNSSDGTFTNYILADDTNGLGFYPIINSTPLAAGKAYLAIPNASLSGAPQFVSMDIEGSLTGIKNIDADMTGKTVYNLNGQRQSGLKKGVNIVGGKKIVVK